MIDFKNIPNPAILTGEHFNNSLLSMKLPFFFDGASPRFYRFEGLAYNSIYESEFRKFTLNLDISLKVKTRFIISMFYNIPKIEPGSKLEYTDNNYFLLNNSLVKLNPLKNFRSVNSINRSYFLKPSLIDSVGRLYGISQNLSDVSLNLSTSYNRFHRIASGNFSDIDTFISGFNANWFSYNTIDSNEDKLIVVNDNIRSFSFLVSGLDNFRVIYSEYHNRYIFSKFVSINYRYTSVVNIFRSLYNNDSYLFIYDNFIKSLDKFLKKNLNLFYYFYFIIKFILYNFSYTLNYIDRNNLLLFLYSNIFIKHINEKRTSPKFNFLKYINILSKNSFKFTPNLFLKADRTYVYNKNLNVFINFDIINFKKYSKTLFRKYRKCHHNYSIHYQPSEIFNSFFRFGVTPTVIAYMTNFKNVSILHYAESTVIRYRSVLRTFFNFIVYFFKRNFITNILDNFNYDSNYIFHSYFSIFRIFSTFNFKNFFLKRRKKTKINFNKLYNIFAYLSLNKKSKFSKKFDLNFAPKQIKPTFFKLIPRIYGKNRDNTSFGRARYVKFSNYMKGSDNEPHSKKSTPNDPKVNRHRDNFNSSGSKTKSKKTSISKDHFNFEHFKESKLELFKAYNNYVKSKRVRDFSVLGSSAAIIKSKYNKHPYVYNNYYNNMLASYVPEESKYRSAGYLRFLYFKKNNNYKGNSNWNKRKNNHKRGSNWDKSKKNNNYKGNLNLNRSKNDHKDILNRNKFRNNKGYKNNFDSSKLNLKKSSADNNLKTDTSFKAKFRRDKNLKVNPNFNKPKNNKKFKINPSNYKRDKKGVRNFSTMVDRLNKVPTPGFRIIFSELFQGIFPSNDSLYIILLLLRLNKFFFVKSSSLFIYCLFCYLFSFRTDFLKYTFNSFIYSDNFYVKDLRIFNSFELVTFDYNLNLFYNFTLNNLLSFDDFSLRVDLYTFVILRRFIEYFRIFKYNEYLFYHLGINTTFNNYKLYKIEEKDYAMLPSFYEFRHALFFNKYLICRLNILTKNYFISYEDIYSLYVKTSFFLFYFIVFIHTRLHTFFMCYFSFYITSNIFFVYFGLLSIYLRGYRS